MKIINTLLFMNLLSGMGYSILSPLFPSLATKKGFTETMIGLIIGIFDISNIFITTFTPLLCRKFTRIKLLYFSTFFEATCTILYGLIGYFINSYYFLLILMFIIRIFHGCNSAIIATLIYSLTISFSKESEMKKAIGNLEIGWCFGISIGPIIASIFYKIGGYILPFIVLGSILYVSVYLSSQVSHQKTESNNDIEEDPPFLRFLTYIQINVILGALSFGMISESFFYPSLTNHLEKSFGLSVSISSLFFIILALSYIIVLQWLDKTAERMGLYGSTFIGLIMASLGVLMVYPYYPFPKKIITVILGLALIGGGGAPIFVPGIISLSKSIKIIEPNLDELSINDISSAIYNLTIAIGDFSGPIIGGFFSTHYGFKNSCLFISILIFLYSIVYLIYFRKYLFIKKNTIRKTQSMDIYSNTDEVELINHPGFYKENANNSFHSDLNSENIGNRKKIYSSLLKKNEFKDDFQYISLNNEVTSKN